MDQKAPLKSLETYASHNGFTFYFYNYPCFLMVHSLIPKYRQKTRVVLSAVLACAMLYTNAVSAKAQQPFITDDTDVTPRRKFHFEFSNQFDVLQRSSYPNLTQNTTDFELGYGLFENLEIGIQSPLITIFNAKGTSPYIVSGIGDMNLSLKYNFFRERQDSILPAMSVSLNMKLPTGDTARQLGTGLRDYYANMILQKSLTDRTVLRLNSGILFTGNEATGAIGIKTHGRVFTSGASIVRNFTEKLSMGTEISGAVTSSFHLNKGQLQVQIGGNYSISKKCTFDFGLIAGRFPASPRIGGQIGFSFDF
jgi:hypothetical protein